MAAAGDLRDIMDMPHEGPRKPAQKKARGAPQPRLCTLISKGVFLKLIVRSWHKQRGLLLDG